MFKPVSVDITDISSDYGFSKEDSDYFIEGLLKTLTGQFVEYWKDEAINKLHQTRADYINAIYIEQKSSNSYVVGLDPGFLHNAVELGISAFDMKTGFANSPKRHIKKDGGWYMTIPFKQATPSAIADSGTFSGKMPKEVYNVMLNKASVGDNSPMKIGEIPEQFRAPKVRERIELPNNKVFEEYTHKSSIYAGIQKSSLPSHSGYYSFRRVSDLNTGANDSFIHTGIRAYDLSGQAFNRLETEDGGIETLVGGYLDKFLNG